MNWGKTARGFAALVCAAIPLSTTVSCNPHSGTLEVFRYDDHHHGFFDVFFEDYLYDDCFFYDCYDYYYDEIVIY